MSSPDGTRTRNFHLERVATLPIRLQDHEDASGDVVGVLHLPTQRTGPVRPGTGWDLRVVATFAFGHLLLGLFA